MLMLMYAHTAIKIAGLNFYSSEYILSAACLSKNHSHNVKVFARLLLCV